MMNHLSLWRLEIGPFPQLPFELLCGTMVPEAMSKTVNHTVNQRSCGRMSNNGHLMGIYIYICTNKNRARVGISGIS